MLGIGHWRLYEAGARWDQMSEFQATSGRPPIVPPPPGLARPVDRIDFRLRVPRLGYEAVVREGVDADVLFGGPGHYPETRWPGQPGNVGLAAHNVYWLRFDRLEPGDLVFLDTRYGSFRYHVTGSQLVGPTDRSALADVPGRDLTLTTCWPLWAGQFATQRLAIFARS